MKKTNPFNLYVPDGKIFEYVISIPCSENFHNYIRKEQSILRNKLNADWSKRALPEINLICFDQQEYLERKIVEGLEKSAQESEPFVATMKNLLGIEYQEIFIQIGSEGAIHQLIKSIKKNCHQLMSFNVKGLPFYNRRHEMRIFGDLSRKQFLQATKYLLKKLEFSPFLAHEFELSRREKGKEKFESVKRFELNWDLMNEVTDNNTEQLFLN